MILKPLVSLVRKASWLKLTAPVALAVFGFAGWSTKAHSQQTPSNPTYTFPLVGIVSGETLRLNIVNRSGSPGDLPPDVCDVELRLVDGYGRIQAESTVSALAAGHANHLDLRADDVKGNFGTRRELRAFVRVILPVGGVLPPDVCRPSTEVYYESTGGTKFLGWPPDPDLPAVQ